MRQYFRKLCGFFGVNLKVEVDFSNFTTKADLKGAANIDTSTLISKTDRASLKTEVDNWFN